MSTPVIDIRPDHWQIVQHILRKHVPQYEVCAFGSRAKWTAKPHSDLDLAVISDKPLSLSVSAALADDFSESILPWKVDVVDWASTNESFRKVIEREKVVVQEAQPGLPVARGWRQLQDVVDEILDRRGVTPLKLGGDFTSTGHRVISAKVIKDGRIDLSADEPRYVDTAIYKKWMRQPLRADDVIMTSEAPLGELAYLDQDVDWVLGQRLFAIRPRLNVMSGRFLYYALSAPDVRDSLMARSTGTTVAGIRQAELRKVDVPVPPIKEQRAITHILGTLDDKIELNRKQNETLEAMARTLFTAWFVDFEPVRAKLEGRWQHGQSLPDLPAQLYDLFPDRLVDSELGEIPEGWRYGELSDLATYLNGYAFKTKDWVELGHPVVKIGNVKPGFIDVSSASCVSSDTVIGLDRFKLNRGDLLIGMTGYVGETGLVPSIEPPAYLNQRVGKISTKSGVADLGFVYCTVRNPNYKNYAELKSHGSAQANVSSSDLMTYPCVVPESLVLDVFNEMLYPMLQDILENYDESRSLAQLRETLLPKLISGELRVSDAEAFLRERGL